MKIALVHDYLTQDGGAEKVLDAFRRVWPDAPIFVLFHNGDALPRYNEADVRESFLAKIPGARKKYQWLLPLMPMATERHDLSDFDVVLSSSSAFAKGVLTGPESLHISYCHTPTRYLWTDSKQYITDLKYNPLIKAFLPRLMHRMRIWDKMSTDRVDHFIANSDTVRARIAKYYRRESDILYPPVDVGAFEVSQEVGDYFLTGGRLVPYKRNDLIIHVFNRLKWPLKIFGDGPDLSALQRIAGPTIEFLGRVSDRERRELMTHAKAFIHPQVEDFGITPVESMASGRPVIAYSVGGARETVVPGKTGIFFEDQSWESLLDAVIHFDHTAWNSDEIRAHAQRFANQQFDQKIKAYVEEKYCDFQQQTAQCRIPIS